MRSHLLTGKVRHRRPGRFAHRLEHDVFYLALDLAELDEVDRRLRLFRRNRPWLVGLHDADHLEPPARDLDREVRALLRADGEAADDWTITLIAYPRVLGYVFNPASFYLCRDASGALRVVIVEVHNTFGERYFYALRPSAGRSGDGAPLTASAAKDFFVSPFISADGRYAFHVREAVEGLRVAITLRQGGEVALATSLVLRRHPLTDRTLLRAILRHPLLPQRTILLILLHAIKLWGRGAPFFRHGAWLRDRGTRPAASLAARSEP